MTSSGDDGWVDHRPRRREPALSLFGIPEELEALLQAKSVKYSRPFALGTLPRLRDTLKTASLEEFVETFSSHGDTIKFPTLGARLEASLFDIFGERLRAGDCWLFLMIAFYQHETTGNPFWPWFVLGIYSRARVLPPPWVWNYLLKNTIKVTLGAKVLRPFDETVKTYSDLDFVEALGLNKGAGKKDYFTDFRKVITDFRLALRVRNLAFPVGGPHVPLMKACRSGAEGIDASNRRKSERERDAETKHVWKAYNRWFSKDGTFRIVPLPR